MDIRQYFISAMLAECYRRPEWIRSVFGVTQEDYSHVINNLFDWRIVRQANTVFFSEPGKDGLTQLGTFPIDKPIIDFLAPLELKASDGIPGLKQDITTTYGITLLNFVCVIFPFKGKIHFQNPGKRFSCEYLESLQEPYLTDTPKDPKDRKDTEIYIDEHLQYMQGVRYLEQFMNLFTPAGSEKTLTCSDELIKRKNELFEQYKDQLDDPAILARIATELEAIDRAWMKGDLGERTLVSKKDFSVVRRELFGFSGGNQGFNGATIPGIKNSLSDGWDIKQFPAYNDAARVAAYDRGHQTALGGYGYKQVVRSTSNTQVTIDDCGTKVGIPITLTQEDANIYKGLYIVGPTKPILLDDESIGAYLGKKVYIRAPSSCKLTETDYCATCVGTRLSLNKTALGGAMASIASAFMNIYMQAAHGRTLATAEYDLDQCLS